VSKIRVFGSYRADRSSHISEKRKKKSLSKSLARVAAADQKGRAGKDTDWSASPTALKAKKRPMPRNRERFPRGGRAAGRHLMTLPITKPTHSI